MTVLSYLLIYFMAQHIPYSIFLLLFWHIAVSSLLYPSESGHVWHISSLECTPLKPYHRDFLLSYYNWLYFLKSSGLVMRSRPLFSKELLFRYTILFLVICQIWQALPHLLFWVGHFLFPLSHNDSFLFFLFFIVFSIFIVMLSPWDCSAFLFCLSPGKTDTPGKSACLILAVGVHGQRTLL